MHTERCKLDFTETNEAQDYITSIQADSQRSALLVSIGLVITVKCLGNVAALLTT